MSYFTSISPQVSVPLHRRSDSLSRVLCAFIDKIDSSLSGCNNEMPASAMRRHPTSADPLMPKLSPQPSNTSLFGAGSLPSAGTDNLPTSVEVSGAASAAALNSQSVHHVGTVKPPCLLNSKEAVFSHLKPKPMDWDETHASTTPKVSQRVLF